MTVIKQVHEIIRVVTMGVLVTTLRQNQRRFVIEDLYKNILTEYYAVWSGLGHHVDWYVNFSHFGWNFCLRIQRNRQASRCLQALSRILLLHSPGKYAVLYTAHLRTFRRTPLFALYAAPNILKESVALIFIGLDGMVGDYQPFGWNYCLLLRGGKYYGT